VRWRKEVLRKNDDSGVTERKFVLAMILFSAFYYNVKILTVLISLLFNEDDDSADIFLLLYRSYNGSLSLSLSLSLSHKNVLSLISSSIRLANISHHHHANGVVNIPLARR